MSTAPRFIPHYTLEEYRRWEGQWELIDGVPISMSPSPFGHHERILSRLSRMIGNQIDSHGCQCEVYTNLDWIISDDTVIRPDLMVVCGFYLIIDPEQRTVLEQTGSNERMHARETTFVMTLDDACEIEIELASLFDPVA